MSYDAGDPYSYNAPANSGVSGNNANPMGATDPGASKMWRGYSPTTTTPIADARSELARQQYVNTLKLAAMMQAHAAAVQQPANATAGGTQSGGGSGAPSGPHVDAIHSYFDNARNQVNTSFLRQMQHLASEHGVAANSVNHQALLTSADLKALGLDANQVGATAAKGVANAYKGATSADAGQYQALLADLTRQGANGQTLTAEAGNRAAATQSQAAAQSALSTRLNQLTQGTVNDRQALSKQTQQGSINDLARQLEGAQANANSQHVSGLNQIAQAQAQFQMQMQAAAAAAARSGGGRGGSKAPPGAAGLFAALLGNAKAGNKGAGINPQSQLAALIKQDPNIMHDPNRASVINNILTNATQGFQPGNSAPWSWADAIKNLQSRGLQNGQDSYAGGKWGNNMGTDFLTMLGNLQRDQSAANTTQQNNTLDPSAIMSLYQSIYG